MSEFIEDSGWIIRYALNDDQNIDMGLFEDWREARDVMVEMREIGVECTRPINVARDYELIQGAG